MNEESLLRIPLVRHLLEDRHVRLQPRRVDQAWYYHAKIRSSVAGFNPFLGRIFYPSRSRFATWLEDPKRSARDLNESDLLVREVLFAVHDYLHVWSLALINARRPQLGLGVAPIGPHNVEDFVFCHLVTEAAATVGLDYWYLCTIDLNDVVPIGTTVQGLTTSYHERFGAEYRRFNPEFEVQERSYLDELCRFYCNGLYRGFDVSDLKRSPRILHWLKHELTYGQQQRRYIRQWLAYLSGGAVSYSEAELSAAVDDSAPWKRQLVAEVGECLWRKVKQDELVWDGVTIDDSQVWRSPLGRRPDFRFVNANQVEPADLLGMGTWENAELNFRMYFNQYLSSFDHSSFDPTLMEILPELLQRGEPKVLQRMLQGQPALPPAAEFRDLLLLN